MKTDIEIAREYAPKSIVEIAKSIGIAEENVLPYGKYAAKIDGKPGEKKAKLILVTAINPTPAGEGKTTVSIGLADGLKAIGKRVCLALREPSLGPVFGMKGGATGGGYAQIVPMEEINLHFTGDIHAITSANNLLCAMIDNHIYQGNALDIDPTRVIFKRCVDLNDRSLRHIVVGLGGSSNGSPREDGFTITAASEIMAILCLAEDLKDLKRRLGNILVGYNRSKEPVYAKQLAAENAMAILLKEAIKPNLVQTLEGTPAFVHGGPFANIAHGCNSVIATRMALSHSDYTVTEAGFGADLGAEKFLDVKCRKAGLKPDAVVLVATIRALKMHGGVKKADLNEENVSALESGLNNLYKHIENLKNVYKLPVVVAINKFSSDAEHEINAVISGVKHCGVEAILTEEWAKGSRGTTELAKKVVELCESDNDFSLSYEDGEPLKEKFIAVATKIYGAKGVIFSSAAEKELKKLEEMGYGKLPVVIAKTQYSLSDDATKLGCPENFDINISEVVLRSGAEFVVGIAGNMMLMPGLGKTPAAVGMTIDDQTGEVNGLF